MQYRVRYKDSLSHAVEITKDSKSKYKGGFVFKNNRLNNSSEYNHDYYEQNKEKWNKKNKKNTFGFGLLATVGSIFVSALTAAAYAAMIAAGSLLVLSVMNYFVSDIKVDHEVTIGPEDERKKREAEERKLNAIQNKNKWFKYKYKITDFFGKVRYFYTNQAYENYMRRLNSKKEACTIKEDIEAVNPKFKTDKKNSDENCAYCTLAYDMRRRGYDVQALNENDFGFVAPDLLTIESWYKNGKMTSYKLSEEAHETKKIDANKESTRLFNELAQQGDGASGFITMMYKDMPGGHAMAYQVIDGNAYILDTQNGDVYNENDFAKLYAKNIVWESDDKYYVGKTFNVNYMRTDNLEPNPQVEYLVKNVNNTPYNANEDPAKLDFGDKGPDLVEVEEIGGATYGSERSKKSS